MDKQQADVTKGMEMRDPWREHMDQMKSKFLDIDAMEPDKYWTFTANEQKEATEKAKSIHAHIQLGTGRRHPFSPTTLLRRKSMRTGRHQLLSLGRTSTRRHPQMRSKLPRTHPEASLTP